MAQEPHLSDQTKLLGCLQKGRVAITRDPGEYAWELIAVPCSEYV
jgi:hypothetical protein